MNISEMKVGSLLEIYIRRDGYNYKVISKVEYVGEDRVGVTPIASRRRLFRFRSSDIVDIVYRLDEKSWRWEKVRAGIASLSDGTKLHVFVPTRNAEVFNRRTTYRLPMNREIDLNYEVADFKILPGDKRNSTMTPELTLDNALNEISESYRIFTCKAELRDLSEGGAAVSAPVKLGKGDIVFFDIPFEEGTVSCRALVIRNMPDHDNPANIVYGLSYIETSSNYIPFFFAEQRKMLSDNKTDYEL